MFGRKLKQEITQLKNENAELRYELDEQKDLTKEREKFAAKEAAENEIRKNIIDEFEKVLYSNDYNNLQVKMNKLKETIADQSI